MNKDERNEEILYIPVILFILSALLISVHSRSFPAY